MTPQVYPSKWTFVHPKWSRIEWVTSKTIILLCFAYNSVNTWPFWMNKDSFWSSQVGEFLPIPAPVSTHTRDPYGLWKPVPFPTWGYKRRQNGVNESRMAQMKVGWHKRGQKWNMNGPWWKWGCKQWCGWMIRVQHGYGNTRGVWAAGMVGTGTVWEIPTCDYTVPITVVSQCHMGTIFGCCHGQPSAACCLLPQCWFPTPIPAILIPHPSPHPFPSCTT